MFFNNAIKRIELTTDLESSHRQFGLTDIDNNYDSVIHSHPRISSFIEFSGFDTLDQSGIVNQKERSKYHLTVATFVRGTRSNYLRGTDEQI